MILFSYYMDHKTNVLAVANAGCIRKGRNMKLTVFGATGATGTYFTELAVAAGHEVTAVVRDPARLAVPAHPLLRVVTADVMDPDSIVSAIAGSDAVVTAIGPRGTGPTTVIQDSARAIIAAMQKSGGRRLVMLSGSIVADEGESPYLRYLLKPLARRTFLRHVCADMRAGESEVRASDLDWTIVRPPSLTSKPASDDYRTAIDRNLPHGFRVSRADLAACMLALVNNSASSHRHISIAA
jgi:putative NADH-flavin reductase